MLIEHIVITALSGFFGAAIGSITTLWLHLKNKRNDERKILNESIHYLFEVFFLVTRMNAEKLADDYLEYYVMQVKKNNPKIKESSLNFIKEQISFVTKQNSIPLMQKQFFEDLKVIGERYDAMLAKLATILPVDAFYLRGKNKLENLLNTASIYFENLQNSNYENAEAIKKVVNQIQPSLMTQLVDEYKNDLKNELLILLEKTDSFNRDKGKRAIKTIESVELTESDKRNIDSCISNVKYQFPQDMAQ